jgi:hypothetical protein
MGGTQNRYERSEEVKIYHESNSDLFDGLTVTIRYTDWAITLPGVIVLWKILHLLVKPKQAKLNANKLGSVIPMEYAAKIIKRDWSVFVSFWACLCSVNNICVIMESRQTMKCVI